MMKKLLALLLVVSVLLGALQAIAEDKVVFTVDEQAYDAYLWISDANQKLLRYMEELETLWRIEVATATSKYRTSEFLSEWLLHDNNGFARYICLSSYVEECGVSLAEMQKNNDMVDLFESIMSTYPHSQHNMTLAGMTLLMWANDSYLYPLENVQADLDQAKKSIRNIIAIDREYTFLTEIQDYYKNTVILYNFINDGSYNYSGLLQKLNDAKDTETAYAIDFEFIFDTTTDAYKDVIAYHNRCAIPKDETFYQTGRSFATSYAERKAEEEKKALEKKAEEEKKALEKKAEEEKKVAFRNNLVGIWYCVGWDQGLKTKHSGGGLLIVLLEDGRCFNALGGLMEGEAASYWQLKDEQVLLPCPVYVDGYQMTGVVKDEYLIVTNREGTPFYFTKQISANAREEYQTVLSIAENILGKLPD